MEPYELEDVMAQILLAKVELARSLKVFDDGERDKYIKRALDYLREAQEAVQVAIEVHTV